MEIGSEAADQKDGPTFTPEEIQKISDELLSRFAVGKLE
jgi:hypothetical protein